MTTKTPLATLRVDKWLWSARFYKTRSLAAEALGKGRIQINGITAKASRELRTGDRIVVQLDQVHRTLTVLALSAQRGSASVAQQLYQESPESVAARLQAAEQRRLAPEPAHTLTDGRPTKRNRRELSQAQAWDDPWRGSMGD